MDDGFWDALRECNIELNVSASPFGLDYIALFKLGRSNGVDIKCAHDHTGQSEHDKEHYLRPAIDLQGMQDPSVSFVGCPFGGTNLQLVSGADLAVPSGGTQHPLGTSLHLGCGFL